VCYGGCLFMYVFVNDRMSVWFAVQYADGGSIDVMMF
jgi:hypothetical protein